MPAPEPDRSHDDRPRSGPATWLTLYVLGVAVLMVLAAGLIVTDDGDPDAGSVLAAAIIVVPSLLLALRVGAWALLGPPLFCVAGFVVLIPLTSGDESGFGLAIGGILILLTSFAGLGGVLLGLFVGAWRWTGRDD